MNITISLLCTIIGAIISYVTFFRKYNKEVKEETKTETTKLVTINLKLDNISNSIEEIRQEQKEHAKSFNNLSERVTLMEHSLKEMKKRIDTVEKKEGCDNHVKHRTN